MKKSFYTGNDWRKKLKRHSPSLAEMFDSICKKQGWKPELVIYSTAENNQISFDVDITEDQHLRWMEENLSYRFYIWNIYVIMFEKRSDAIAFKLRWL